MQSPTGTRICLNSYDYKDEFFQGQGYTQTIFDDQAETPIEQGAAPFTGRFRPKAGYLLEDFNTEDTYGTWRLQVYDAHYHDTGSLKGFKLTVTEIPEPATAILLVIGVWLIRSHKPPRNRKTV